MVNKGIIFVLDASGNYLNSPLGKLRALDSITDTIYVISPLPTETVVMASYLVYDMPKETISQFMELTELKGSDLIDEDDILYQTVADYNVWGIPVTSRALAKISKYRAGRVGIGFSFKSRWVPAVATVYLGTFGYLGDIPTHSTESLGDYYVCDTYNYVSAVLGITLTKGDIVYSNGTAWVKPNQTTQVANSETVNVPVDPAILANLQTAITEESELELLIAQMQSDLNDATFGALTRLDDLEDFDDDIQAGDVTLSKVTLGVEPNVVEIVYMHTNGNNYQVVDITYPDGRVAQINEELYKNFRNTSGITLNSGRVLVTTGVTTGNQAVNVELFNPMGANRYRIHGVTTVDGIGANAKSKTTSFGIVTGILISDFRNTGVTYAEGQQVFAHEDGRLSNVAPAKPNLQVCMGIIINVVGSTADVLVCERLLPELEDLSNVTIASETTSDILVLDSDGIWKNSNRLVTAESDIDALQSDLSTAQSDLDIVEGKVDTLESEMDTAQTDITALENAKMFKTVAFNGTTGVLTFTRYDDTTSTVDLPTELIVSSGTYDDVNQQIVLILANGDEIDIPVADIFVGLATEEWVNTQLSSYYTKSAADTLLSGKVDKVTGSSLVDDDEITKLVALDTQAETDTAIGLKIDKDLSNNTLYPVDTLQGAERVYIDDNGTPKKTDITAIATFVNAATGSFVPSGNYADDGLGALSAVEDGDGNVIADTYDKKVSTDSTVESGEDVTHLPSSAEQGQAVPLIEGNTLQASQLVTNGDFSDGTTGWSTYRSIISVFDNVATVLGNVTSSDVFIFQSLDVSLNDKIYVYTELRTINTDINTIRLLWQSSIAPINISNPIQNQWYSRSGIVTATTLTPRYEIGIRAENTNGKTLQVKKSNAFNISTLISNKQYSPIYNTTFDLMSDANIKTQMDAWVANGTLPNDEIQSVSGNKEFKSVSEDESQVSELYLQPNQDLNRLPNGVKDTQIVRDNKYFINKRLSTLTTVASGVAVNTTNYPLAKNGGQFINYFDVGGAETGVIGTNSTTGAGKMLYELATVVETEILAIGNIQSYPSGTIYVSDTIGNEIAQYGTNITTEYDLVELVKLTKVYPTQDEEELDVSLAVITGNTFTHSGLASGDYIAYTYRTTQSLNPYVTYTIPTNTKKQVNLNTNSINELTKDLISVDNQLQAVKQEVVEVNTTLLTKVDMVEGYGLSEEDFTSAEKVKLSNLDTQAELDTKFGNKVDKVAGKSLVADTEITKLGTIAEGAEVNVNANWNSSSGDSQILNKPTVVTGKPNLTLLGSRSASGQLTMETYENYDYIVIQAGGKKVDTNSPNERTYINVPVSLWGSTIIGIRQVLMIDSDRRATIYMDSYSNKTFTVTFEGSSYTFGLNVYGAKYPTS